MVVVFGAVITCAQGCRQRKKLAKRRCPHCGSHFGHVRPRKPPHNADDPDLMIFWVPSLIVGCRHCGKESYYYPLTRALSRTHNVLLGIPESTRKLPDDIAQYFGDDSN